MRRAVVDLQSYRPIWAVPPETLEIIEGAFGQGWEIVNVSEPTCSDGDGSGSSQEVLAAAREAEVYFGFGIAPKVAEAACGTLRWVHSAAAGARASLSDSFKTTGAMLTNSRGIHAEPVADWVVMAISFCLRGGHAAVAGQHERRWSKDSFTDGSIPVTELSGTRVGVVGLGGIGQAVARRCLALTMEVRGVRRRPESRYPDGVTWVGGPADLLELASHSEVLVICAPHTEHTEELISAEVLESLPRGAYVINPSRGALVDEVALLEGLESGRLGGCVLDVFAREPLAADHPFWDHPKVLVTPHISAVSDRFWGRENALIADNIGRYLSGAKLRNLVNIELGY